MDFSWMNLIDRTSGAWFRIRDQYGRTVNTFKSPTGKVDCHAFGACCGVLTVGVTHRAITVRSQDPF